MNFLLEGGKIVPTPRVQKGFIIGQGEHFRLLIGQDFVVGYEDNTDTEVKLYITETLTFQIIDDR